MLARRHVGTLTRLRWRVGAETKLIVGMWNVPNVLNVQTKPGTQLAKPLSPRKCGTNIQWARSYCVHT